MSYITYDALLVLVSLALDLGAGQEGYGFFLSWLIVILSELSRRILFRNWETPFANNYYGIGGAIGRFLGFWAVLMQACFSFFGAEVPGVVSFHSSQ